MKMKNNLDEMQEQELLKIEHNGCWLAFWLLLIALVVESIAFKNIDFRTLAGEWIVFMVLTVYLAFACIRRGIWDRRIPMNAKANLIMSLIAAVVLGIFNAIIIYKHYQKPVGTIAAAFITAAVTFIICFAIMTVMMKQTQKQKAKRDEEPSDANEM